MSLWILFYTKSSRKIVREIQPFLVVIIQIHPDGSGQQTVYTIYPGQNNNNNQRKPRCLPRGCWCSLDWKGRFREKILQTRRLTSSAGSNLVYPARHGLPATTVTVDIPLPLPLSLGARPARPARITGWWMVPTNYTVSYISQHYHSLSA